jgi:hypothetical protein
MRYTRPALRAQINTPQTPGDIELRTVSGQTGPPRGGGFMALCGLYSIMLTVVYFRNDEAHIAEYVWGAGDVILLRRCDLGFAAPG